MGSICCTRIPFILIAISQSHRLPLSDLYSANPQVNPKTHISTNVVVLFLCHDSHDPLCLWIHPSIFRFLLFIITSYHTFLSQSWQFCLLSAPLWSCCLHTLYCYLFLAIGPCTTLPLTSWYITRIGCTDHLVSFNIIGYSSPLLLCRLVDLRRGLIYSKNFQHQFLYSLLTPCTFRLHFCNQPTFPLLGALIGANI